MLRIASRVTPLSTYWILAFTTTVAVLSWYAYARGQDVNWDQLNYHLGLPRLLATGHFWDSIAPAGLHSYITPTLYQAQFAAVRSLPPLTFAALLAGLQTISFLLAAAACANLAGLKIGCSWRDLPVPLLGFLLCLLAPVPLSEAGTTFIDVTTASLVLAAYLLLLTRGTLLPLGRSGFLAGLLLGLAVGFKLTNLPFLLGCIGFALAGPDSFRQRLRWLALGALGAVLGELAVAGWWHWALWTHFGNPVFPFFNGIFKAAGFPPDNFRDNRFTGILPEDLLIYPWSWLTGTGGRWGDASVSAEMPFRDARWIILLALLGGWLAASLAGLRRRAAIMRKASTGLALTVLFGFVIWLGTFGIQRYLAPLDLLCGAMILLLAQAWGRRWIALAILAPSTLASLLVLKVPDWGHWPWADHWQTLAPTAVELPSPSLVLLTSKPTLYVAANLRGRVDFVEFAESFDLSPAMRGPLVEQLEARLREPGLHLYVLYRGKLSKTIAKKLAERHLVRGNACRTLTYGLDALTLCRLRKTN